MNTTDKLGLRMPGSTDSGAIADLNFNALKLDTEVSSRIKTINGESADEDTGDFNLDVVPYARQLVADDMQRAAGEVLVRATGGGTPISNGTARLSSIQGRMNHVGYVREVLAMNVDPADPEDAITATIDRDQFVQTVSQTSSLTFVYSSGWKLDGATVTLATYGITVTGTAKTNDQIIVSYVKEERGTITVSNLSKFVSTGWNLYNHEKGYAHVQKYSETYGFKAGGFTALQFSETENSERQNLYPDSNGLFVIPSDGYIWGIEGNDTDSYILMTWSDWTDGYPGSWAAYEEHEVSVAAAMNRFPYGMMQVDDIADELVFNYPTSGNPYVTAISRVGRMAYNSENLANAKSSGRKYTYDENYIYLVKANADTYDNIAIDGTFTADDHGSEFLFISASVTPTIPVFAVVNYPQNLVSKLRMDVVTLSEQTMDDAQKEQVRTNIGAADANVLSGLNGAFKVVEYPFTTTAAINANKSASFTAEQFHVVPIEGYSMLTIQCKTTGSAYLFPYAYKRVTTGNIVSLHNCTPSSGGSNVASGKEIILEIIWIKSNLLDA